MMSKPGYESFSRECKVALCWLLLFVLLVVEAVHDRRVHQVPNDLSAVQRKLPPHGPTG
jgi:hypothetical protein